VVKEDDKATYVACVRDMRNAYKIVVRKPDRKTTGKPGCWIGTSGGLCEHCNETSVSKKA
jgi:hypothetical protein